jgi:hypothetical protein
MKKNIIFNALLSTLTIFFALSLQAKEALTQPSGSEYFIYQAKWLIAPKPLQNEAYDKAIVTLAKAILEKSNFTPQEFIEKKIAKEDLQFRVFIQEKWKKNIAKERAFIVLAKTHALKKWFNKADLRSLINDTTSYPANLEPLIGTLRANYFLNPSSAAILISGNWAKINPEEEEEINTLIERKVKSIKTTKNIEGLKFSTSEGKKVLLSLYDIINDDNKIKLLNELKKINEIGPIDGSSVAASYTYNFIETLPEDLKNDLINIHQEFELVSPYVKRSGADIPKKNN